METFWKTLTGSGRNGDVIPNKELVGRLQKGIIRETQNCIVISSIIVQIWGTELADMQLRSSYNINNICYFNNINNGFYCAVLMFLVTMYAYYHWNMKQKSL